MVFHGILISIDSHSSVPSIVRVFLMFPSEIISPRPNQHFFYVTTSMTAFCFTHLRKILLQGPLYYS